MMSNAVRAELNMSSQTLRGLQRSIRVRGRKAETSAKGYLVLVDRIVFDILQSQNDDGAGGKQHFSDFPAFGLKRSVHCKEI